MPDLANAGALEVLDPFVDKYGYCDELQKIAPTYRDNQMMVNGKIYGFPDDGDVFVMYYRKDVLGDPAIQTAYKEKFGTDLPVPPTTWKDFDQVGAFITEFTSGKPYGAAFFREAGYGNFMFQERFRNEGGKFFDAETMKATINTDAGVKVFTDWLAENKFGTAGRRAVGFRRKPRGLPAGPDGDDRVMAALWPLGREATARDQEVMSWVPKSTIAGKVGYAMPPGGHPELAAGFCLSVASGSKNKEAAYLFIQWLNSEAVSLERVKLPYALRDPFRTRISPIRAMLALWPDAKDYLAALQAGCQQWPARPVAAANRQVRGSAAPVGVEAVGGRGSEGDPRCGRRLNGMPSPRRSASTSRRRSMPTGRRSREPIQKCSFGYHYGPVR